MSIGQSPVVLNYRELESCQYLAEISINCEGSYFLGLNVDCQPYESCATTHDLRSSSTQKFSGDVAVHFAKFILYRDFPVNIAGRGRHFRGGNI